MTRKRIPQPSSHDLSHQPFRDKLADLPQRRAPQLPPPPAAPSAPDADDADLFLRAMSGTVPRKGAGRSREKGTPLQNISQEREQEDRETFLRAVNATGPDQLGEKTDDISEDPSARSRAGRMRQLKQGLIRIGAELDLHGLTRDEALFRLKHFIADCRGRGMAAVLVITGKGANSTEGPVLREAVPIWFRGQGKEMVAEWASAPRDKGGSGAFVVFIKGRG